MEISDTEKRNFLTVIEEGEDGQDENSRIFGIIPFDLEDVLDNEDIPEVIVTMINDLKENEKNSLNEKLREYLGNDFLDIEDFPETMKALNTMYQARLSEYKNTDSIDFEKFEEDKETILYKVFFKEVYEFLNRALGLLEES